jgi:hypothetical protein
MYDNKINFIRLSLKINPSYPANPANPVFFDFPIPLGLFEAYQILSMSCYWCYTQITSRIGFWQRESSRG